MKPEETEDEKALMRVADVMTGQVICLRPDMSVESVTQLFLEHRISGAPVIDDDGRPIGVLGVIGPTRLDYRRVIPVVRATAQAVGAALNLA